MHKLLKYSCNVLLLVFLFCTSSCVSSKSAVYFSGQGDTTLISQMQSLEYPIQANDLLSISVSSLNPDASIIFNTPNVSNVNYTPSGGGSIQSSGYLVNPDGYIQFPILGNIKAGGLTKAQLRAEITEQLLKRKLLVDPIVNVRHLNFKVTVLGEVGEPTVITVPNEKITLMEALGLAGDLTIYGKRDNVMIIRETGNKKEIKRLNLNSRELLTSPYYHLKPNDIIYVEPTPARITAASNTKQWLPLVLSGLSFVAIIVTRIFIN